MIAKYKSSASIVEGGVVVEKRAAVVAFFGATGLKAEQEIANDSINSSSEAPSDGECGLAIIVVFNSTTCSLDG